MKEEQLLEHVVKELGFMKQKIIIIEQEVREINEDLHEVRPDYLKKLKRIEKEGTISEEDFERKFNVSI